MDWRSYRVWKYGLQFVGALYFEVVLTKRSASWIPCCGDSLFIYSTRRRYNTHACVHTCDDNGIHHTKYMDVNTRGKVEAFIQCASLESLSSSKAFRMSITGMVTTANRLLTSKYSAP